MRVLNNLRPNLSALLRISNQKQTTNISRLVKSLTTSADPKENLEKQTKFLFCKDFIDEDMKSKFLQDMTLYENYITPMQENSLFEEISPALNRIRYEKSHWDNAISNYREVERKQWTSENKQTINGVINQFFHSGTKPLEYIHVLDLKPDGVIFPHVDSVKFCGSLIVGLSLLSDSVMRLRLEKNKSIYVDVLLKSRSLYVMTGIARYDFTHEILGGSDSRFGDEFILRARRISVIFRNAPN